MSKKKSKIKSILNAQQLFFFQQEFEIEHSTSDVTAATVPTAAPAIIMKVIDAFSSYNPAQVLCSFNYI